MCVFSVVGVEVEVERQVCVSPSAHSGGGESGAGNAVSGCGLLVAVSVTYYC